ncbi:1,2-phenylacetyl-CoA epoxidase subunit PaaD [Inhella gelatinilytica]|uniref:Phenylacetate-CoA oxygenase subunit PaaJ n=1 Tax=Inhella gelatinilytica TaxID=2795030 RepID=A0A931ISM7_9BURK|nr:1,2-phenylacetyl-CoA epoxidase subunit PaaD [Inhella gelatinilytica]MBH9551962.1 phenylacetate-CoA oxygenase subunit PaaJ [Inhella gelatinilytica]
MAETATPSARWQQAWAQLATVLDPEVPALTLVDLGIVRELREDADGGFTVVLTPTYSGCPATELIETEVKTALAAYQPLRVEQRRTPAWTTDWIGPEAREKLRQYGIAPPSCLAPVVGANVQPLRLHESIPCPRCGSPKSERLSAFGSTACKALYRCTACREPFEYFKPI